MRWQEQAECRGMDPNIFHPSRGESAAPAQEVCARCPVVDECLNFALDNALAHGVYGGLSERARRKVRSGRSRTIRCGECDTLFEVGPRDAGATKYCSGECARIAKNRRSHQKVRVAV